MISFAIRNKVCNRTTCRENHAIATEKAAQTTLDVKGRTSTQEGDEARQAMMTRRDSVQNLKETALGDVMDGARVYLAGGQEYVDDSAAKAVRSAAMSALERLYPKFEVADDHRWGRVLRRALDGDASALDAVDYSGNPEDHPVCEAVLDHVGSATKGSAVRSAFAASPHGWPQDAVDAALALLTHTNHVRARRNGQEVGDDDLTQRTISTTRFRAETVQIGRRERIQIRKAVDGIVGNVEPNEELEAVDRCLDRMQGMADRLGGPPPFPKKPDVEFIKDVERHAGNEKLQAFYERKDTFLEAANRWQSMLNLRDRRESEWNQLQKALDYVEGLDEAQEVSTEATAIQRNRSLLEKSDPVRPLLERLTEVLRDELRARHERYEAIYDENRGDLTSAEPWSELGESERQQILARNGLDGVPEIHVGTTEQVLDSLDRISLDNWEARIDALPQRFDNALSDAAKAVEPDTVRVRLASRVLRSEDDVEEWLDEAREQLYTAIEDGPVQV